MYDLHGLIAVGFPDLMPECLKKYLPKRPYG